MKKAESSEVMTGAVGDTVTVAEADPKFMRQNIVMITIT